MNTNRIVVFDTTLRDGEQSPGAAMNRSKKERLARALEQLGVDVIEAGFPSNSPNEASAVAAVARAVKRPIVCAMARAVQQDVDNAARALEAAVYPRVNIVTATSHEHMELKLHKSPEQVLEIVHASVLHARRLVDDVQWTAEDGYRSDMEFLLLSLDTAIDAGATTVCIPDTVGYATPHTYEKVIRLVVEHVAKQHPNVCVAVHCHNDLGLAVANTLNGIHAGARQVECTINGIGERSGNAALEEVVMGVVARHDRLPYTTGIDTRLITRTSHLVSAVTGMAIAANKPIVGMNAFRTGAGMHQDGELKQRGLYTWIDPHDVGADTSQMALTKHTGRHAIRGVLEDAGVVLDDEMFEVVFERFKNIADVRPEVTEAELLAIVEDRALSKKGIYEILRCDLHTMADRDKRHARVTLYLRVNGVEQEPFMYESDINDKTAMLNGLATALGTSATCTHMVVQEIGEGPETPAQAWITLEQNGVCKHGYAFDPDSSYARLKAYLNALNALAQQGSEE